MDKTQYLEFADVVWLFRKHLGQERALFMSGRGDPNCYFIVDGDVSEPLGKVSARTLLTLLDNGYVDRSRNLYAGFHNHLMYPLSFGEEL